MREGCKRKERGHGNGLFKSCLRELVLMGGSLMVMRDGGAGRRKGKAREG